MYFIITIGFCTMYFVSSAGESTRYLRLNVYHFLVLMHVPHQRSHI